MSEDGVARALGVAGLQRLHDRAVLFLIFQTPFRRDDAVYRPTDRQRGGGDVTTCAPRNRPGSIPYFRTL